MRGIIETDLASDQWGRVDSLTRAALDQALAGEPIGESQARHLIELPRAHLALLLAVAGHVRTARRGRVITYSPKVFLPITNLCRNRCHYCTFRRTPDAADARTLLPEAVRRACREAEAAGCIEALLCLGDKPERAFPSYRGTLAGLGCSTTIDYVERCCRIALEEGLLPHTNAGLMTREDMTRLKPVNASIGLMLESISPRLRRVGGPHHHAPDKEPTLRLQMIRKAGELRIPFTTGILVGIGETLAERVASLAAIAQLHRTYGHIQEIIIQNFRAKPTTPMAAGAEPHREDMARTVAVARLLLPAMNVQVPPNLNPYDLRLFLAAGINDWGGISPVTRDFVNPEAPWPQLSLLAATCRDEGFTLVPRSPIYAEYVERPGFLDPSLRRSVASALASRGVSHAQCPA